MARSALQVKDELQDVARVFRNLAAEPSQGRKGMLIGACESAFGSTENRHLALSWLFRDVPYLEFSTKNLTNGEWYALSRWIGTYIDDEGYHTNDEFGTEALMVVRRAVAEYAAMVLGVDPNGLIANGASLPGLKVINLDE